MPAKAATFNDLSKVNVDVYSWTASDSSSCQESPKSSPTSQVVSLQAVVDVSLPMAAEASSSNKAEPLHTITPCCVNGLVDKSPFVPPMSSVRTSLDRATAAFRALTVPLSTSVDTKPPNRITSQQIPAEKGWSKGDAQAETRMVTDSLLRSLLEAPSLSGNGCRSTALPGVRVSNNESSAVTKMPVNEGDQPSGYDLPSSPSRRPVFHLETSRIDNEVCLSGDAKLNNDGRTGEGLAVQDQTTAPNANGDTACFNSHGSFEYKRAAAPFGFCSGSNLNGVLENNAGVSGNLSGNADVTLWCRRPPSRGMSMQDSSTNTLLASDVSRSPTRVGANEDVAGITRKGQIPSSGTLPSAASTYNAEQPPPSSSEYLGWDDVTSFLDELVDQSTADATQANTESRKLLESWSSQPVRNFDAVSTPANTYGFRQDPAPGNFIDSSTDCGAPVPMRTASAGLPSEAEVISEPKSRHLLPDGSLEVAHQPFLSEVFTFFDRKSEAGSSEGPSAQNCFPYFVPASASFQRSMPWSEARHGPTDSTGPWSNWEAQKKPKTISDTYTVVRRAPSFAPGSRTHSQNEIHDFLPSSTPASLCRTSDYCHSSQQERSHSNEGGIVDNCSLPSPAVHESRFATLVREGGQGELGPYANSGAHHLTQSRSWEVTPQHFRSSTAVSLQQPASSCLDPSLSYPHERELYPGDASCEPEKQSAPFNYGFPRLTHPDSSTAQDAPSTGYFSGCESTVCVKDQTTQPYSSSLVHTYDATADASYAGANNLLPYSYRGSQQELRGENLDISSSTTSATTGRATLMPSLYHHQHPSASQVHYGSKTVSTDASKQRPTRNLIKPSRILCGQLRVVMPIVIRQFETSAASRKCLCRQLAGRLYHNSPKPSPNFLLNTLLPVFRAAMTLEFNWGFHTTASLSYLRLWVCSQRGGKELIQQFRVQYNAPTGKDYRGLAPSFLTCPHEYHEKGPDNDDGQHPTQPLPLQRSSWVA